MSFADLTEVAPWFPCILFGPETCPANCESCRAFGPTVLVVMSNAFLDSPFLDALGDYFFPVRASFVIDELFEEANMPWPFAVIVGDRISELIVGAFVTSGLEESLPAC